MWKSDMAEKIELPERYLRSCSPRFPKSYPRQAPKVFRSCRKVAPKTSPAPGADMRPKFDPKLAGVGHCVAKVGRRVAQNGSTCPVLAKSWHSLTSARTLPESADVGRGSPNACRRRARSAKKQSKSANVRRIWAASRLPAQLCDHRAALFGKVRRSPGSPGVGKYSERGARNFE